MQAVFVIGQGPVRVSVKENIRAPFPGRVYHPERVGLDPVKVSMGEKKPLAAKAFLPGIGQTRRIRGTVAVSPWLSDKTNNRSTCFASFAEVPLRCFT